jgi:dihydrofolate synthase/folylpolyglutamate synthase
MNYEEALDYIHRGFFGGTRPGLARVKELLARLGDPQDGLRFIHVAGTNGKGSFCAMTDSVLRTAGYRTGLYTSPYIERFNERMMFDGVPVPDDELAGIVSYVKPFADAMEDRPTEFELITAVAMVFFARHRADPVVLEVGMGGRLDATNVINDPLVSVITGISLDHTAILGDTVAKIAAEKAGIIKPGVPVVWGGNAAPAARVIHRIAAERGCECSDVRKRRVRVISEGLDGTVFSYAGYTASLSLLGTYQPYNAANVITAVEVLRRRGLRISDRDLLLGLRRAVWKARFELISASDPVVISDGSHNPEGISAAVSGIRTYFGDGKTVLLTGVMKDKDYPAMADSLSEIASEVFTLRPDNPRSLDPELFAAEFRRNGIPAESSGSVHEAVCKAVRAAREQGRPLVALGSLYMYREVREAFRTVLGK